VNLLTVKEAAQTLRASESKVRGLLARGDIPVYRIGGSVRVAESDLTDYLARCRENSLHRQPLRHLRHRGEPR
jgi:excisionase family DNA binding protein